MNSSSGRNNFLDIEPSYSAYASSRFVVLPIPYEGTVSYGRGTSAGPEAILKASSQVELYDQELRGEFFKVGIFTAQHLDCNAPTSQQLQEQITSAASKFHADDKFVLALGGEHTVSVGLVKAAAQRYPDLSVLHLDAHADLRDSYQQNKYSHACVLRRIWDLSIPTVSVGVRSYCTQESQLIEASPERLVSAREVARARTHRPTRRHWMDQVLAGLSDTVYVTLDVDVFDPSQAPGTGTPEPGGLDWYEVTSLLRRVSKSKQIVSADIVEVIPNVSGNITEFLAAKLAYKIISYSQ